MVQIGYFYITTITNFFAVLRSSSKAFAVMATTTLSFPLGPFSFLLSHPLIKETDINITNKKQTIFHFHLFSQINYRINDILIFYSQNFLLFYLLKNNNIKISFHMKIDKKTLNRINMPIYSNYVLIYTSSYHTIGYSFFI